eukprot:TRINITY_DN5009_c0_g4_i1.p1 TRINITY_DN5009_c0_g4~~TRINITY_DN5009_c0_g4_i1.p1  ORF type:complete len:1634 (+),score=476.20 TRINITY_DN5009_c0_g4_i1:57-4904(+)
MAQPRMSPRAGVRRVSTAPASRSSVDLLHASSSQPPDAFTPTSPTTGMHQIASALSVETDGSGSLQPLMLNSVLKNSPAKEVVSRVLSQSDAASSSSIEEVARRSPQNCWASKPNSQRNSRGSVPRSSVGFSACSGPSECGRRRRSLVLSSVCNALLTARQLAALFTDTEEDSPVHAVLVGVLGVWTVVLVTSVLLPTDLMLMGWTPAIVYACIAALSALAYSVDSLANGAHVLSAASASMLPIIMHGPRHIPAVSFLCGVAIWGVAAPVAGNSSKEAFPPVSILVIVQAAITAAAVSAPRAPVQAGLGRGGDYVPKRVSPPLPRHASFRDDDERRARRPTQRGADLSGSSRRESTFMVRPLESQVAVTTPRLPQRMSDSDDDDEDDSSSDIPSTGHRPSGHLVTDNRLMRAQSAAGHQLVARSSVSSAASSHATSYVSFVASLNRRGEGGGFSLKRHSTGSQVSICSAVPEDALDDAESFNRITLPQKRGQRSSLSVGPTEPDSQGEDRRGATKRKRGHTQTGQGKNLGRPPTNARSARSATTVRARGPPPTTTVPPVPPNPPPSSMDMAGVLDVPAPGSPVLRAPTYGGRAAAPRSDQAAQDAAREVTESTRELVKKVLDYDFTQKPDSGQRSPSSGKRAADAERTSPAFRTLPATTLQKLVVLFGRLSEELDTFRAQQFIVACVCEIVKCDRAAIFLAEWKRKEMWTITNEGHDIRVPMEKSLAGYAALYNRLLNIKDAQNDTRFNTEVDKKTGYLTRNVLVYPISRGLGYHQRGQGSGEIIAVIQAINKVDGELFTQDDESLLALLGKQAGIHLYNSQVYVQLQVEGVKTKTLLEVSKEISEVNLDLGSMMTKIMTRARQVLLVERATIFLIDEERQELWSALTDVETVAQLGSKDGPGGEQGGMIRVPVGVGLAGHVAVTGSILNVQNAYECELFNPEYDRKTGFVTRSILVMPIKPPHANKVMGVIQFINKVNGDPFFEDDEELATSFSSYVGVSLNNIILYEELREGKVVREQNKELQRLREMAEQAAESKSNFLMAMSHEIRTPMSGVIGMCELLANTPLSAEQREMNDTIRNCGEALLAIINDVLDYGKIGSGKLELEQREFNIVAMLEETIDVIRSKTEGKSITITLDADPHLFPNVIGDNYRLRQIIINLVGNACKFTPERGSIGVSVGPDDEDCARMSITRLETGLAGRPLVPALPPDCMRVRFSVSDTGIGISKAAQQRLFQPFEQAEVGTTRQYGGTGLGLAICKQLVEAMKGQIGIISELGAGTEFWFTAVFGRPTESPTLANTLLTQSGSMEGLTVVMLVTHSRQRAILESFCRLLGLHVFGFEEFDEILAFAKALPSQVPSREEGLAYPASRTPPAPFVPNVFLVDGGATGITQEGCDEFISVVMGKKALLPEDARPTHCHIALMMNMAMKVDQGTTLTERGVTMVLAKPPKQQQLISLFCIALQGKKAADTCRRVGEEELKKTAREMKLLVAEDNPTNQLLIKKQLKGFGIVPTICDNGQLAVDKLVEEYHDLVFMDCHMPVLDGYGASKKIRELEQEGRISSSGQEKVTIVALTADALPQTRQVCLDHGMDDYATKPLRKAQLSQVLDKYWFKDAC